MKDTRKLIPTAAPEKPSKFVRFMGRAGVTLFAVHLAAAPLVANISAKVQQPQEGTRTQQKLAWEVTLSGDRISYKGMDGNVTSDPGMLTTYSSEFAERVAKLAGKESISEVNDFDKLAGSFVNGVVVAVLEKGIITIWISTSASNPDDKTAFLQFPFDAKNAAISENGTMTVEGKDGEKKTYKLLRGEKNQPQIVELKEAEKK